MTIRRKIHLWILATALFAATGLLTAEPQTPAVTPETAALSAAIPVDREITIGRLPNGLRYYVRANKKPEKRAELRLAVKAGSILEDEDQQGLAHFVEHMAFNGTKNFPKQEVISFMQSLGMRFGAHVNAYTSFDETVYMLHVPTDKPEVLDRALLVLKDWAQSVSFEDAEIEKERGVVMEEWRASRGAGMRMTDKLFPVLLAGSRYAERLPIGKPEVLQNFKPDRLKQFYSDWYRPDLMAVVAVGDFDRTAVEAAIRTHFAPLVSPATPRQRQIHDIPDRRAPVIAVSTDKEMTSANVSFGALLPAREQGTVGVYRHKIVDRLFSGMLSARLSELAQKPDAPFLGAFVGRHIFLARTKEETTITALVKEDGIDRGLEALLTELQRVTRFGFTPGELDRQRQTVLRAYERMLAEKENRESRSRADEYIRNFLEQETLPTNEWEYGLHQRFLAEITLGEVNALAKDWFPERNRLVVVMAPEKSGVAVPDQAKLSAIIKAGATATVTPYVDTVTSRPLLDATPAGGTILKSSTKDSIGITEWELSNGVKVVLKPTTFRADEIWFRATSPGGTSLASDADYIPASTASQLVAAGGVGKFSAIELRKLLTGKVASASPFIGELEEGLTGNSSQKDLETMFQLIYLRFTEPRPDPTMFSVQAGQAKAMLANQGAVPEFAFFETLATTRTQNHPRRRVMKAEMVDEWNLDKSVAFYKDRFADASDFTFVFVGSFEPAALKPLVEKYLGSLPSLKRKETWKDVGVRSPKGVVIKTVEKGIEPKSQVAIVLTGPFEYVPAERVAIRAMADALESRLLETIREELGGTYSISANANYQRDPIPEYSMSIQFGCAPDRADALVKRVFEEIERLKTDGPTDKQVSEVRETLLRDFESNTRTNNYLLSQISLRYQYGEDPAGLWEVPEYYKKLDAATIRQAARKYLDMNNYIRVTLYPEKR